MPQRIRRCGPRLSESTLQAVEQELGVRLPEDYRKFMLEFNGGRPVPEDSFDVQQCDQLSGVERFSPIDESDANGVLATRKIMDGRLPPDTLAIADAPCGDLILLTINGHDVGSVFFWDHEDELISGGPPLYANAHRIADSFSEFFRSLRAVDLVAWMRERGHKVPPGMEEWQKKVDEANRQDETPEN